MAIATASRAVNMNESFLFDPNGFNPSPTKIVLTDPGVRLEFTGTNFTYDSFGVTGGTLNSVKYSESGVKIWAVTGLDHSAAKVNGYVLNLNENGLLSYLFNGADTMRGSAQADVAKGYGGADKMNGNGGNDKLSGMGGNDTLNGGAGRDVLAGGAGADNFVFSSSPQGDTIRGFVSGVDKIRLDDDIFTQLEFGTLAPGELRIGAGLQNGQDGDDRLIYDTASGKLYYDADADGAGTGKLVAVLTGAPDIVAADIRVVE